MRGQCSPNELIKLIASDAAANDIFGNSVSMSGNTVAVGALNDDNSGGTDAGSAYVFVRTGGVWNQQAILIASDASPNHNFGYSVSVFGDTLVVGSLSDNAAGATDPGAAYVFTQTGGVWTEQAKLTASDAAGGDRFGVAVSIYGDTVLIGANGDDTTGGTNTGSAYVFTRSGGLWTQQAKLIASDAAAQDFFGAPLALEGDMAVIAAPVDDNANGGNAGSAYVFTRSGSTWIQQAKLTPSNGAANDIFGSSVALSGDTALIGANGHAGGSGSVYAFIRVAGTWTQQAELRASDFAGGDQFGYSAVLSGGLAVIGADGDDFSGISNAGSAYVFTRTGATWTQQAKLTASDAAMNDNFGRDVAVLGNLALIGSSFDDHAGGISAGSAYVFNLNCFAVCCAGDCDGNHVVDIGDVPDFVATLLAVAPCPPQSVCCPGDLNADIRVDGFDIQLFVNKLLSGGACG